MSRFANPHGPCRMTYAHHLTSSCALQIASHRSSREKQNPKIRRVSSQCGTMGRKASMDKSEPAYRKRLRDGGGIVSQAGMLRIGVRSVVPRE